MVDEVCEALYVLKDRVLIKDIYIVCMHTSYNAGNNTISSAIAI